MSDPRPTLVMPPLIDERTRLLFVGINPGLRSAEVAAPFAHRSNRFWKALHAAGILDRVVDAYDGVTPADREHILARGVGVSTLVQRATRAADELAPEELVAGVEDLRVLVAEHDLAVVAVLGIGAYRTGFRRRTAQQGVQEELLGGAELRVLPNPSGLNAGSTLADLAAAFRDAAVAAGVVDRGEEVR
ncbi:mismatch-specific DNA-glycosylase [Microbacterium sp. NPDC089696]|uniref:mismatch-specific DNA-glycosylase n=1 Tax=Microbacterium sp. NPDC089696 TaxID=3364199 RepID=UPI00381D56AE